MITKVYTALLQGLNTHTVQVEVDYRHGMAYFAIVGLADKAVQEAKDRITSAIKSSEAEFIPKRLVVNLAPANLHKSGPHYDLAIAVGVLVATEQLQEVSNQTAFIGELGLDGQLRAVKGVLPIVFGLKHSGFTTVFVPWDNYLEANLVQGIEVKAVKNLKQVIEHLNLGTPLLFPSKNAEPPLLNLYPDFAEVKGPFHAKRAAQIAAAGAHNMLISGVPGAGKSMIAKCFPGLLPDLNMAQALQVAQIYSVAGMLSADSPLNLRPPFRSPHHTSSQISIVGGGNSAKPGEVSLAQNGVLFLDEFTEFDVKTLEALRQPLEDKIISISRASYSVTYPADFILLAAMNPCKCGHLGDPTKACICSQIEITRYTKRISGPILDRVDLVVHVHKIDYDKLFTSGLEAETTQIMALRVKQAIDIQLARQGKQNSHLSSAEVSNALFEDDAINLLQKAAQSLNLSARTYFKLLKVARTIADLQQMEFVNQDAAAEALSYKT